MYYDNSNPSLSTMKCPYKKSGQPDPHKHIKYDPQPKKICNTILDAIGNTPMVRLNKIPKEEGVECEILAKCEYLNPSGSMKDRIAKRMVEDAEESGRIVQGKTKLVEPSSGNTGIAFALVSAVKQYPLTITMNEKMSQEKEDVMTGLGAKVIRTPGEAKYKDKESLYQVCQSLQEKDEYVCLDQYTNTGNSLAHYDGTGSEILYQCDNKVDVVVIGTGTCGTLTGISRRIKEVNPNCKIIAVDPFGSVLSMPQSLNEKKQPHDVEGIGKDFIPRNLDRDMVDKWVKVGNEEAQPMARRLFQSEGLFCGGSSGAIVQTAINYAKEQKLGKDVRIVCLLADNVRNYLTKFLQKEWMVDKGLMQPKTLVQENHQFAGIELEKLGITKIPNFTPDLDLNQAMEEFERLQIPQLPIVQDNKIASAVPQEKLTSYIIQNKLSLSDKVQRVWTKEFSSVKYEDVDVACLERLLARRPVVFVMKNFQTPQLEIYPVLHKHLFPLLKRLK
ncbi:Tryptophan synthase beta subunit-like PLP-dependent enzymes superfamily [Pseudocohnilembus persalinus]|uniref:cystathionine beta-synthase n=1 Tax=Pseudocohnilembus persalinus TaxID=266149 RepID=A0A0V0R540_PSEPJ|nr:Tryptophan synthase beta subunit-like PLP-dependent enzymes superfamily [Pseudocohnilembus persalinus]|eukprot:KRX09604.1 Tryptophan synthase beta subunit-like PLP-dependent enzymes superfamily [Pseudocohnilembus persalinus]